MISIKKYLEASAVKAAVPAPAAHDVLEAALNSYRASLREMGRNGQRVCPAFGASLQQNLSDIEGRLAEPPSAALLDETGKDVGRQLSQWGQRTAEHLKGKTEEVKDLLLMLARTAEALGERDDCYAAQLNRFTTRLRAVADLEDLTEVRLSLMQTAG